MTDFTKLQKNILNVLYLRYVYMYVCILLILYCSIIPGRLDSKHFEAQVCAEPCVEICSLWINKSKNTTSCTIVGLTLVMYVALH